MLPAFTCLATSLRIALVLFPPVAVEVSMRWPWYVVVARTCGPRRRGCGPDDEQDHGSREHSQLAIVHDAPIPAQGPETRKLRRRYTAMSPATMGRYA